MKPRFAAAALALSTGCVSLEDSGGSRFYQSDGPTKVGSAIFTNEVGFQDASFNFSVRDTKVSPNEIAIGHVGDESWQGFATKNAVWSKDDQRGRGAKRRCEKLGTRLRFQTAYFRVERRLSARQTR